MKKLNLQINKRIEFICEEGKMGISLIQDIQPDFMLVSTPMIGGREQQFRKGEEFDGVYYGENHVFVFTVKMLERVFDNIALYKMTLPTNLKKIQRRDFVRIPISIPFRYMEISEELEEILENTSLKKIEETFEEQWEKGYTMDLSGGGLRASVKKPITIGEKVFIILKQKKMYVGVKGEVLRCHSTVTDGHTLYHPGIKYIDILEGERERIIAFIFAEMRELRRKR